MSETHPANLSITSPEKSFGSPIRPWRSEKPGALRRRLLLHPAGRVGITKPEIRRIARRAGVKRFGGPRVYDEARHSLREFLQTVLRDVFAFTEHSRRMTVSVNDVLYALKRRGMTLYGHGRKL